MTLAEQLCINYKAKNIRLKIGEEGLLIHASDLVGAMNSASRDVASDSLLIFPTN